MGWESNDFDWLTDKGYTSEGGLDFGDTSDYSNNLDVTNNDYSGAWTGYGDTNQYTNWENQTPSWTDNTNTYNPYTNQTDGVQLKNPSYNYTPSTNLSSNWGGAGESVQGFLKDLFEKGSTTNTMGQLAAALASGYQNKKLAGNMQQAAQQTDPWASQRPFYQQQAQQAVTDPYASPIVKAQIAHLQNAQNIKDAAAGRRSNQLTSSPALMAAMAQVAQNYQKQMADQGGASINPSASAQLLSNAANAQSAGYLSPIAQLFGYQTGDNTNSNKLSAALQQMSQGKA